LGVIAIWGESYYKTSFTIYKNGMWKGLQKQKHREHTAHSEVVLFTTFLAFLGEGSSKSEKTTKNIGKYMAESRFWSLTHPPTTVVSNFFCPWPLGPLRSTQATQADWDQGAPKIFLKAAYIWQMATKWGRCLLFSSSFFMAFWCVSQQGEFKNAIKSFCPKKNWGKSMSKAFGRKRKS
jgi:hypothetical protein